MMEIWNLEKQTVPANVLKDTTIKFKFLKTNVRNALTDMPLVPQKILLQNVMDPTENPIP